MRGLLTYLFLLLFSVRAFPQDFYKGKETVEGGGITYKVTFYTDQIFTLSNINNKLENEANWRYKDGRILGTEEEMLSVEASFPPYALNRALKETLGDEVIASLRGRILAPLSVYYVIGPEGNVLEVSFLMHACPEFLSLPPEVYAALERKVKEYSTWELNDFAKQLEYFHMFSFIRFETVPLESELFKIDSTKVSLPNLFLDGAGAEL